MISADEQLNEKPYSLFERTWNVPWQAHVLPVLVALLLAASWFFTPATRQRSMALSWAGLERGRTSTIWLHMFAHANFLHLAVNCAALLALSGPLIARLGQPPLSWLRYIYIFIGSGLAGAALFLLLNHSAAMLGASGAIFGIFGALARVHPRSGKLVPVRSRRTWLIASTFVREHLLMFALLGGLTLLLGRSQSIAWQAHLGGLLFGIAAASIFLENDE